MDWLSLVGSILSGYGKKSTPHGGNQVAGSGGSAGGWFSTSTAASGETGDNTIGFGDFRPVYNPGLLSSLEDIGVEKVAIIAGVLIVGAVVAVRVFKGK